MSLADVAEQSLKGGDPVAALAQLQEQVRAKPADPKLRVFLFQLLCVLGQWERALNQLNVASSLDPGGAGHGADLRRRRALRGDPRRRVRRQEVADDLRPARSVARAADRVAAASPAAASTSDRSELRAQAFDEAPASPGDIDGRPFAWIADADSRLGPVLEAVINGRYYWVPFSRLTKIADRAAGGPARHGLDAGAPAVRERRRIGGAHSDPLSRVGDGRRTA